MKGYNLELSNETPCCLDPNLFASDPLLSMLRIQYNVALAGGITELISNHDQQQHSHEDGDGKLRLLKCDILGLKCSCESLIVRNYFEQLKEATSHKGVVNLLHHIEVVFRASDCQHSERAIVSDGEWKEVIERYMCTLHLESCVYMYVCVCI